MFFNLLHKVKLVSKDFATELTSKPRCDNYMFRVAIGLVTSCWSGYYEILGYLEKGEVKKDR